MVGNIHVNGIGKSFPVRDGVHEVLRDVSFLIRSGELLVLFGPGQCGKTVLMDIIAGLMPADSGTVVTEDGAPLRPEEICVVFQKYAPFPWKTCLQNVELPMKFQNIPRQARRERAMGLLKLVGLEGFEDRYPRELSGGMKQRVSIACAYAKGGGLLLMDEPFGALDAQTRLQMEQELLRMEEQERKTTVLITNSIDEALLLGDTILLLGGSPASILDEYDLRGLAKPRSISDGPVLELRSAILRHGAPGLTQ